MEAIICAINSKYIHSSLAPWYLCASSAAFCSTDVSCRVVEGTINQPAEDMINIIKGIKPDVLAFSCYIWNIDYIRSLLVSISEIIPDVPIILGGPEVSFCAPQIINSIPQVNYILIGEGEKNFAMLLDCLNEGKQPNNVPGLVYRYGNEILSTDLESEICSQPPSPYTPDYFRCLGSRIAYLETSRGCPFSCSFCLSGRSDRVRFFDLDRAKGDMLLLAKSAKTIKLVDRTFNCNTKRAYDIFDFLISKYGTDIPEGVRFHFEVGADLFDERTLELLASAPGGLFQFEAGLQSFNEETLEAVNRKTDLNKLVYNLSKLISRGNIHIHVDLIAGLPYETLSIFKESFNKAFSLRPHMLQLGFLKMLHGSHIRRQANEFNYSFSSLPPYEFEGNFWFSPEDKQILTHTEDALDRLYNSGRFLLTIDYLLSSCGLDAFSLFHGFGEYSSHDGTSGISLEDYTALVFEYCKGINGADQGMLRDIMVCDRMRCENTGRIPPCLHIPNPETKRILKVIKALDRFKDAKGASLSLTRLYNSEHKYVLADYRYRDTVTGHYRLYFFNDYTELNNM